MQQPPRLRPRPQTTASRINLGDSAREGFARELVQQLRTGAQEHRFGRLIIAAPPVMLGVLRDQLDEQLRDKLVAALHEDLTKIHAQELPEHLSEWITVDPPPRLAAEHHACAWPLPGSSSSQRRRSNLSIR